MSRGRRSNVAPIDDSPSGSFLAGLVDVLRDQNRAQGEQFREMFQANGHNNHNGGGQPIHKQFMGFKPAEFKGSTNPMAAEEWMQSMLTIFEFMQISDADRIRCASFMFRDDARIWWQSAKTAMDLSTATWEQFKEVFYGKYFTLSTRNRLAREFLEIRQGDGSIADYVKRFERGKYFAPMITGDATTELNHFLEGLNAIIRRDVRLSNPSSMREAIDRALMAEKDGQDIVREAQAKRVSYQGRDAQGSAAKRPSRSSFNQAAVPQQSRSSWSGRNQQQRPQQQQQQHPHQQQHQRAQSARAPSSSNSVNVPVSPCVLCGKFHMGECLQGSNACFICKKSGHFKRDCPQRNNPNSTSGRVFAKTRGEADPNTTIISGNLLIANNSAYTLIDTGATQSIVSTRFVQQSGLKPDESMTVFKILLP